jgi:hypothetical protein
MQDNIEHIKLPDTAHTCLPLGYKKIHLKKIPLLQNENKLLLYNKKYNFDTRYVSGANKPISKIINLQ